MNQYAMTTPALHTEKQTALLLTLTKAVIVSFGAGACFLRNDARLAFGACGMGAVLLGAAALLSAKRTLPLLGGVLLTLGGGTVSVWSIVRLLTRQAVTLPADGQLLSGAMQLLFLAAGLGCVCVPLMEISQASRFCTKRVAAECIRTEGAIVWRYRCGDRIYDFTERRCVSLMLPRMGERCVLHIDPKAPERACRIDRTMTAMQIAVGLLLLIEVVLSLTGMAGGMLG